MITQEQRKKVADIVKATLVEHFADEFVFDPIKVIPAVDEYGDGDGEPYLRIMIVFDGDQKALDPRWTSGLIRRIRPTLIEAGVEGSPSPSFVEKSEWPRLERSLRRAGARSHCNGPPPGDITRAVSGSGCHDIWLFLV